MKPQLSSDEGQWELRLTVALGRGAVIYGTYPPSSEGSLSVVSVACGVTRAQKQVILLQKVNSSLAPCHNACIIHFSSSIWPFLWPKCLHVGILPPRIITRSMSILE